MNSDNKSKYISPSTEHRDIKDDPQIFEHYGSIEAGQTFDNHLLIPGGNVNPLSPDDDVLDLKTNLALQKTMTLMTNVKAKRAMMDRFRNNTLTFEDAYELSDEDIRDIEEKNQEIKMARVRIKLNKEKILGILPGSLSGDDIAISYQKDAKDIGQIHNRDYDKAWYIICQDS